MNWDDLLKAPNPLQQKGKSRSRGIFDPATTVNGIFDKRTANTADIGTGQRRASTKATSRIFIPTKDPAAAIDHIEALPEPDETLHFITAGAYIGWDVVPAVLHLAQPASCLELIVTTYAFNMPQLTAMCELIDAGRVKTATLVCALLFQKIRPALILQAQDEITARGGRLIAVRNHTKLYMFSMSDGRHLVGESSANLRSRTAIEQWTLTNSRELYLFHREWIEGLFARTHR